MGADVPKAEWEDLFDISVKPDGTEGYPTPQDLLRELDATDELLKKTFADLPATKAGEEPRPVVRFRHELRVDYDSASSKILRASGQFSL